MDHPVNYLFYGISMLLMALVLFLFWEHRHLQQHIVKVRELQLQYESYSASVRSVLKKNDKDESRIDPFKVVNRTAGYLKASTQSYIKDQQLDVLEHSEPLVQKTTTTSFKIHQATSNHSEPTLKTKQKKRTPLTNISFARPMQRSRFWLSSFFGPRKKPNGQWGFHNGLDMAAHRGTSIKSVADGVVEVASFASGYGNTIVILHDAVYKTRYAHLDAILVEVGQKVCQGDLIGKVGDTGFTRKMGKDASHLHLEIYENGKQVNPMHLIDI